ncbi:excalibur calcium-binding domain-containing protein [Sphingomonas sp. 35-24ZXX]|uniref:excalibur calcium-binding domain-containing protein n=1 Tax=Sphingomonas sp. 35-24ZXX TaxID=1545915 RepID=UPI00053BEA8F|nr:excalibur calcium-binding domain-containing protein [Sphingomonas sp. 35-24ZXX]
MAEAKGNSLGTLGFIALAAFIAGRWSVDPTRDPTRAQREPSYLVAPAELADQSAEAVAEEAATAGMLAAEQAGEAAAESTATAITEAPDDPPAPVYLAEPTKGPEEYVYWRNCSHARAVGAAPVRVGDPGYRAGLDRDGDGIGCE